MIGALHAGVRGVTPGGGSAALPVGAASINPQPDRIKSVLGVVVDTTRDSPAPLVGGVTWNPFDASTGAGLPTFSNGNLTVTKASSTSLCRATLSQSSGKFYFEVRIDTLGASSNTPYIAVVNAAKTCDQLNANFGAFGVGNDAGVQQQSPPSSGHRNYSPGNLTGSNIPPAVVSGDVYGIAIDITNGFIWTHLNGTYDQGNPSTGSSPNWTGVTGLRFPVTKVGGGDVVTGRFTRSAMGFTVPTGFLAWDGT